MKGNSFLLILLLGLTFNLFGQPFYGGFTIANAVQDSTGLGVTFEVKTYNYWVASYHSNHAESLTQYQINFDDGLGFIDIGNLNGYHHQYAQAGNYHIVLRGMLDVSMAMPTQLGRDTLDIELSGNPNCNANFNFITQYANQSVVFNDYSYSTSGINQWQWIIDNTDTLYEQNPTYQFNTWGNHQVCLSTTSNDGCEATNCKTLRLFENDYHCTINEPSIIQPDTACLMGISYAIGENLSYNWAVEYNAPNYVTEGTDSIWLYCKCDPPNNDTPFRLIIQNTSGCFDMFQGAITYPDLSCNSVATINTNGLYFEADVIPNCHTACPLQYVWYHDEVITTNYPNTSYYFRDLGEHEICYYIISSLWGLTDLSCQTINLTEPDPTLCNADFSVEALSGTSDTQNVIFNNQSIGASNFRLQFGDNTETYTVPQTLNHLYTNGTYEVCLTALGNQIGDKTCKTITIPLPPAVGINVMDNSSCVLMPVVTQQSTTLLFNAKQAQNSFITVSNLMGQTLWQQHYAAQNGYNQIPIDLDNAPAGVYIITLQTKEIQWQSKILKH
jgi:PKD repeat protein